MRHSCMAVLHLCEVAIHRAEGDEVLCDVLLELDFSMAPNHKVPYEIAGTKTYLNDRRGTEAGPGGCRWHSSLF